MTQYLLSISFLLLFTFTAITQPEIVENGQPSDSAKPGLLTTSGEGCISINAYVSQISIKIKGDIIITARSKDKIKITGDTIKPEILSDEDIDKYLSGVTTNAAVKAAAKKTGYLIYRGVDGEVKLNDNRFYLKCIGKVEEMTIYGIGVAYFDGDGKYKVTKEGSDEIIEQEWQKLNEHENNADNKNKKKQKQVLIPVIYGDYQIKTKAKPKPKPKN
jgi:hypothetical protein